MATDGLIGITYIDGLLSHSPVDVETLASQNAENHPHETGKLSHSICLLQVYLTETSGQQTAVGRGQATACISCR